MPRSHRARPRDRSSPRHDRPDAGPGQHLWLATLSTVRPRPYPRLVAMFVIETYLSRARASDLEVVTGRLRDAIAALTIDPAGTDSPVRWLHSYFLAEDEMCLHVVEAVSVEAAVRVSDAAGLIAERVVEAALVSGMPRFSALGSSHRP